MRATFDREAELYGRARPAPPPALLAAILEQGHLAAGDRVLAVGCGMGQATRPLAEHGLKVHALELGPFCEGHSGTDPLFQRDRRDHRLRGLQSGNTL